MSGETITKSHASARCAPGPTATPLTAATVGLSSSQSSRMKACTPLRSASEVLRTSNPSDPACATVDAERSMPAQKASPTPVTSKARTSGSARQDRNAATRSSRIWAVERVLRFRAVEDDAGDVVVAALDADHGRLRSVVFIDDPVRCRARVMRGW